MILERNNETGEVVEISAEELTYREYTVTEADFLEACNRASYWAKRRAIKKMTKTIYRGEGRSPKDAEEYVKNFVFLNKDKQ